MTSLNPVSSLFMFSRQLKIGSPERWPNEPQTYLGNEHWELHEDKTA